MDDSTIDRIRALLEVGEFSQAAKLADPDFAVARAEKLKCIFSIPCSNFGPVKEEDFRPIRIAAALSELTSSSFGRWLPNSVADLEVDPYDLVDALSNWTYRARSLEQIRSCGLCVRILPSGVMDAECSQCRALSDKVFTADSLPSMPLAGCDALVCKCALTAVACPGSGP